MGWYQCRVHGDTWGSFDNSTPFKMAVGKNKRLSKGKKGIKKRVADPFTRKDWFDVKAPSMFETKNAGKTFVNRSTGLKNAADGLRGRVFELSLGDLNKDEENSYRKIKLRCDRWSASGRPSSRPTLTSRPPTATSSASSASPSPSAVPARSRRPPTRSRRRSARSARRCSRS